MAAFAFALGSCSGTGRGGADSGNDDPASAELARARALTDPHRELPARPDVVSLAESLESRALKEGAGARAVDFHAAAAALLERVWRIDGREQDAKEALDLYAAASRDPSIAGACEAALRAASFGGDVARDASTTYAELYRAQRRFAAPRVASDSMPDGAPAAQFAPATPCARAIEDALASWVAFRPPARFLEAIDEGLAGEGAIAAGAAADAAATVHVKPPQVMRVEQWPSKDASRIVLVLDRAAKFRAGDEAAAGGHGAETFVELDGVDVGAAPRDTAMQGIVSRVRAEATTTGTRLTLDHEGDIFRRVFYLPEPFRVVIDIARHAPGAPTPRGHRNVGRVVLDPGHGGTDPGAKGLGGAQEKDITLDIAHRTAPVLARDGIQVILTRDEDKFVSLEERTARANAFGADLFISIHCNASPAESRGRRGIETYTLDTTRDEIANRVAARENATSQEASAEIGSLLTSMRLADQASRSTRFAELLQRTAMASLRMNYEGVFDGGVHYAGFYVLVGARMPSVLFETSYISNPTEEQRLATEDYRQRLSDAIVNAVKAYREGR